MAGLPAKLMFSRVGFRSVDQRSLPSLARRARRAMSRVKPRGWRTTRTCGAVGEEKAATVRMGPRPTEMERSRVLLEVHCSEAAKRQESWPDSRKARTWRGPAK